MRVPGGDAKPVIDDHDASIAGVIFRADHYAIRGRVYWRSVIRRHIDACVERAFTAERVKPLAEAVRDMSEHWPNRWCIGGIGETERRHQTQSAR